MKIPKLWAWILVVGLIIGWGPMPESPGDVSIRHLSDSPLHLFGVAPAFQGSLQAPLRDYTNSTDIESFFDVAVPSQLLQNHIAGATVSVVRGNETLFSKGYGYSDYNTKTMVSADDTLFRVGSISKLFTWTAVLQLVEQGDLDLDADVNSYLTAFQIAPTFPEPVTLRHLMTHTAGFEETFAPIIAVSDSFGDLESELRENLPPRHWAPGTVPCYSNFGTALAGYIVQEVSGEEFNDYVEHHILDPLNMTHSTFRQPLPAAILNDGTMMAKSHFYAEGTIQEGFFEYVGIEPAGSLSSTADDMAKFMAVQLSNGSFNGVQILQPSSVALMHNPQFQPYPGFPSIRLGMYDVRLFNYTTYGHGGDTSFFHSQLTLIPEYNLGLFVSYNSRESIGRSLQLHAAFIQAFLPTESPSVALDMAGLTPMDGFAARVKEFTGYYETTRVAHETPDKLYIDLYVDGVFQIRATGDGYLVLNGIQFVEVAPDLFRDMVGYGVLLCFIRGSNGRISHFFTSDLSIVAYERVGFLDVSTNRNALLIVVAAGLGSSMLFWTLEGIIRHVRRRKGKQREKQQTEIPNTVQTPPHTPEGAPEALFGDRPPKENHPAPQIQITDFFAEKSKLDHVINWPQILVLIEVVISGIWVGLVWLFHGFRFDPALPYDRFATYFYAIPFFIAACALALVVNAALEWAGKNLRRRESHPLHTWEKAHYSLVAAISLLWCYMIYYWNFFGFPPTGIA